MVYTPMLNERGGYESDLTVLRLAPAIFLLITGSAQATRDQDWILRHTLPESWVSVTDVTAMYSVLSLMGPLAPPLLARVSPDDVSRQALPVGCTREIDLGHARVRVARMSYVGGLGFELYVPVEMTRHVYQNLHTAGADLGLRDAGYYALDALRIERTRRAWGAEMGPDETPMAARMIARLPPDKHPAFLGQQALREQWDAVLHKKLVRVVVTRSHPYLWGGEPLLIDGETVGEISSAGWGYEAGACVGLAYVRGDWAVREVVSQAAFALLWGEPVPVLLHDLPALS
jgi:4-methylaminobutanoate oxidase (formaldehyde-forming)